MNTIASCHLTAAFVKRLRLVKKLKLVKKLNRTLTNISSIKILVKTAFTVWSLTLSGFSYSADSDDQPLADSIESWIEKKIQKSTIINPSAMSRKKTKTPPNHYSLREAIQKAQQQYPGTVLGANRVNSLGKLMYRIKIISSEGIVEVIDIEGLKKSELTPTNEMEDKKEGD